MRRLTALLLLQLIGCGGEQQDVEPDVAEEVMGETLTQLSQLADLDGQTIQVEGTYRKRMSQRKMNDPKLYFFGFVDVELEGGVIQLSSFRRDDAEVEAFVDKRVRVSGKLVLDRGAGAEYARPDPKPTLLDPGEIALAE